jgi:hypothetical protein
MFFCAPWKESVIKRHDLRQEIICDLRFLNDNDQMKTTIDLMEFVLNVMTIGARPAKK